MAPDGVISSGRKVPECASQVKARAFEANPPHTWLRSLWLTEPRPAMEIGSPDRAWFASVRDANIFLRSTLDGAGLPLTQDGGPDLVWDIEAPRSSLSAGMVTNPHFADPWSPNGQRLFAIRLDRRAVPDLPFVRYVGGVERPCAIKLQRAGGPIDVAQPYVFDVRSRSGVPLQLGDTRDRYFTLVGWLRNGSRVFFTRHSRDFKEVELLAGDPGSGSAEVVLSERADTFVAIQHDVIFGGTNHMELLPDSERFVWRSARTGWNHLYLYTTSGRLERRLTEGQFAVIDVVAVDRAVEWLYFTAHHDQSRPYDTHLCRVRVEGGPVERLTPRDGHNEVFVDPSAETFTCVNSRVDRPYRTDRYQSDGRHLEVVSLADRQTLADAGCMVSEEFYVIAADGQTQLWGVLHRPSNLDPARRYPIIDHIYGGPQVSFVSHDFGSGETVHSRLDRALAQLGYIVINLDARGTPERSKAFHDVVYRNWGRHEIPDHVAAIRQLAMRHPFMDTSRVGVWGHSWGGYFAARALAQAPAVYKAAVSSAPAFDPRDSILYEPYLDLPERAPAAYDFADLYQWADKIEGKLLMIAGTADPSIFANTMRMSHRLIKAGVDHELAVIPDGGHVYADPSDEAHFVRKLVAHFERHLRRATA